MNGTTGSFTRPSHRVLFCDGYSIGSRSDETHYLTGEIAALEIYQTNQPSEIPEELKKIVIENQKSTYKFKGCLIEWFTCPGRFKIVPIVWECVFKQPWYTASAQKGI